jgi:hypothetical protein
VANSHREQIQQMEVGDVKTIESPRSWLGLDVALLSDRKFTEQKELAAGDPPQIFWIYHYARTALAD